MSVVGISTSLRRGASFANIAGRIKVHPTVLLGVVCVASKAFLFISDHQPAFQFGDSFSYLNTAVTGWIPPDRSFSYGFFLRWLCLPWHSVFPLLVLQTLMSAGACLLVGVLLMRYFKASLPVAVCFSFLCAIEPIQTLSERFVMTEALATFGFSFFVWSALSFLNTGKLLSLAALQIIGVVLVSLRYSFLPLVLLLSLALPLLLLFERQRMQTPRTILVGLSIAVVLSQALLFGYRQLYGYMANTLPAYLSRDGYFLIADVAPLVIPKDFPVEQERSELFEKITIPLSSIDDRRFHRWSPGGLCEAILFVSRGGEEVANYYAKKMALNAAKRNPLGVVRLAVKTYLEFFNPRKLAWALQLDEGNFVSPTEQYVAFLKKHIGIDPTERHFRSPIKRWHQFAGLWCWLIVVLPLMYAIELTVHRRMVTGIEWFLLLCAICILGCAIGPVEIADPRYLIPLPWLSVLILGSLYVRLRSQHI